GIVAGFLASIIVGGGGLIQYLLSGVIGAFVGGYLLRLLGVNLGISNPLVSQIVTSTIGAIVVVLVARMIS
ncbi:MAG: GlsB/YeaQ/YmgE family stress response membrane protein, partial [Candidatus Competibacteraceae bacterium]|nr:GlsB/YeaQ/YmgE family stress response membrane protein [Candidatus Competibacteraceae bacterium]